MPSKIDDRDVFIDNQTIAENIAAEGSQTYFGGVTGTLFAVKTPTTGHWQIFSKGQFTIAQLTGGGPVDGTTYTTDDAVIGAVNTDLGL